MNTLPEELLTHIFSVGVEEFSSPKIKRDKWGDPILPPQPSVFHVGPFNRRHPKPFAKTAALVSSRWRMIVHLKSNAHLWVTSLNLLDQIPPRQNTNGVDLASSLFRFRNGLGQAEGSDLDVSLDFTYNMGKMT